VNVVRFFPEVGVMSRFLKLFDRDRLIVARVNTMRSTFAGLRDGELSAAASHTEDLATWIALAATAAYRVLRQSM
jgi:hypothetical protein